MPAPWNAHLVARIMGEIHGQETVNVLHFATNTNITDQPPPHPLLIDLGAAVLDCVLQALLPAVTQDWRVVKVQTQFLGTVTTAVTDTYDTTAPANSVGELGPTSVSFAASGVDLKTGFAGRRGRGRIFLPPPGEPQVAASEIDGPTLALITTFLLCMAGKFLGSSPSTVFRWGVYSRKTGGGVFGNFDAAFHVIAQASPRGSLFVIGRRKKGRGD
jgi:hypothetical protein